MPKHFPEFGDLPWGPPYLGSEQVPVSAARTAEEIRQEMESRFNVIPGAPELRLLPKSITGNVIPGRRELAPNLFPTKVSIQKAFYEGVGVNETLQRLIAYFRREKFANPTAEAMELINTWGGDEFAPDGREGIGFANPYFTPGQIEHARTGVTTTVTRETPKTDTTTETDATTEYDDTDARTDEEIRQEIASGVVSKPTIEEEIVPYDPVAARAAALWEYSSDITGRRDIYEGIMRARPGWGQLNPMAQRGLGRMFDPLSAQYELHAAQAQAYNEEEGVPYAGQDFRAWMEQGQQPWGQTEWRDELADLSAAFNAFTTYGAGGTAPTKGQIALRDLYSDQGAQNRLMAAVMGQRISPFLRRLVPRAIQTWRQQIRERDPARDPFATWVTDPQGSGLR